MRDRASGISAGGCSGSCGSEVAVPNKGAPAVILNGRATRRSSRATGRNDTVDERNGLLDRYAAARHFQTAVRQRAGRAVLTCVRNPSSTGLTFRNTIHIVL